MKSKRKGMLLKLFNPVKLMDDASVKSVITKVSSNKIRIILVLNASCSKPKGSEERRIPIKQKNKGGEIGLVTNFFEKIPYIKSKTATIIITGNLVTSCTSDSDDSFDDGYYDDGYYDDGYYDDGYYDDGYYDDGYYDDGYYGD